MLREVQPHSQARTKALFNEEHQFIAPGLQTIALLSELAIERGEGATLTDLDGHTYLDLNAGVSVASLGHAHPRYVAALSKQLESVSVGSFTSRPRAELVRLIAVTRIALPKARVRLAAGRTRLTREGQALCFFAGANSIFYGNKLLTAANPAVDADLKLLHQLGLKIEPQEGPARTSPSLPS